MTRKGLLPPVEDQGAFAPFGATLRQVCQRAHPAALGCAVAFALAVVPARAGLISAVTEGPANAPYTYNLTVEFPDSDYYNFVLRSTQATMTGYDFINTVASLTPGMTVAQVGPSAYGYYINGITIGNDTNSGFANNDYWAYWNGTGNNPVQWTSSGSR